MKKNNLKVIPEFENYLVDKDARIYANTKTNKKLEIESYYNDTYATFCVSLIDNKGIRYSIPIMDLYTLAFINHNYKVRKELDF